MTKDSVMGYWIEAATGELRSQTLDPHDLRGRGASYAHEIEMRYAHDAVEVVIIPFSSSGSDWARAELRRLDAKSREIQRGIRR